MGMQMMPINVAMLAKMTNEQLVGEFKQKRNNIGFELLGMGAILAERKKRPYNGDFKDVIRNEFGFGPVRGYQLMKAWKERNSYIEKVHSSELNYKLLEAILMVPIENRDDFIEKEHPEDMTSREAIEAAKKYKARAEAAEKARKDAEENARLSSKRIEQLYKQMNEKYLEAEKQNKLATEAAGELQSIKLELAHKQSELDTLKHQQKMNSEVQVIFQDSPETQEKISQLETQIAATQEKLKQQTERAEYAERSQKAKMDLMLKAQAELQALKNGMSLQVYSKEHEEYAQYQSTTEEDYRTAGKALKWFSHLNEAPQTEPEVQEWIRCLLLHIEDKPYEMASRRDDVATAMRKLKMVYDALAPTGLKVVK